MVYRKNVSFLSVPLAPKMMRNLDTAEPIGLVGCLTKALCCE